MVGWAGGARRRVAEPALPARNRPLLQRPLRVHRCVHQCHLVPQAVHHNVGI